MTKRKRNRRKPVRRWNPPPKPPATQNKPDDIVNDQTCLSTYGVPGASPTRSPYSNPTFNAQVQAAVNLSQSLANLDSSFGSFSDFITASRERYRQSQLARDSMDTGYISGYSEPYSLIQDQRELERIENSLDLLAISLEGEVSTVASSQIRIDAAKWICKRLEEENAGGEYRTLARALNRRMKPERLYTEYLKILPNAPRARILGTIRQLRALGVLEADSRGYVSLATKEYDPNNPLAPPRGRQRGFNASASEVSGVNDNQRLIEIQQQNDKLRKLLEESIVELRKEKIISEAVIKEKEELKTKLEESAGMSRTITITRISGKRVVEKFEDVFHVSFPTIIDLAKARREVLLYGPTGSGKTHTGGQVAKCFGLPFYSMSCTTGMSEGHITGSCLPMEGVGGKWGYLPSDFVTAYENGGVYLLDEMDAADPNILLVFGTALSNGYMNLTRRRKNPRVERHPDFICLATVNTLGTGGDRMYSGRNKLDIATLDRFAIGKVFIGYDKEVERKLCPSWNFLMRCWTIRTAINEHRLERAMSTRFIRDSYFMVANHNWGIKNVDSAFFAGWREDEINKVKTELTRNNMLECNFRRNDNGRVLEDLEALEK